jgi:hypothetical protein
MRFELSFIVCVRSFRVLIYFESPREMGIGEAVSLDLVAIIWPCSLPEGFSLYLMLRYCNFLR